MKVIKIHFVDKSIEPIEMACLFCSLGADGLLVIYDENKNVTAEILGVRGWHTIRLGD